jgi:hypothetical protein
MTSSSPTGSGTLLFSTLAWRRRRKTSLVYSYGGRIRSTRCRRGTAESSTWSAGRRRRRRWPAGSGWGRAWSLKTTKSPGSSPLARDGSNKPSRRSQCSRATATGEERTVAEAVVEAEGLGEVLEEAWATIKPDLMEY